MQSANDIQIGGGHYKARRYQHWDFVCDTGLHYLLGCFTKYVSRWRDKNGRQDLEKSLHYLHKAEERHVSPPELTDQVAKYTELFASQHNEAEARAIRLVMMNDYVGAANVVREILSQSAV